jgi:hypothetical protein
MYIKYFVLYVNYFVELVSFKLCVAGCQLVGVHSPLTMFIALFSGNAQRQHTDISFPLP